MSREPRARLAPGVFYGRQQPPTPEHGGRLPVALTFPAPRRLALSTLGWQAVFRLLSRVPTLAVERAFLESEEESPRACDSGRPLDRFPVLAVSLNVEEELRSLAALLRLAGVPQRRADRPDWPLVLAGGPLAFLNPAPLLPAADLVFVGEAEAGLSGLMEEMAALALDGTPKQQVLQVLARRPGVLVPGITPLPARRAVDLGPGAALPAPAASCFVSPETEFRDMFLLEVNRGCPHGCRFCAAGFLYRPPRQAELAELQARVEEAAPAKVGLVGTALTDWPDLLPFLHWLHERRTAFSLSSLRADRLTPELLAFLRRTGARSLTLALEGPSRRLRQAAGKRLDEAAMLAALEEAARLQYNHVKLYFIAGWPGETEADLDELAPFLAGIKAALDRGRGKRKAGVERVTVSASCLVPKPWTPFQWAPMAGEDALNQSLARFRAAVKPLKGFSAKTESPFAARLQGLLARGGEDVWDLACRAAEPGVTWRRALQEWDGDPAAILDRERGRDEPFPWECVDIGVSRDYLWQEWEKYREGVASPACPAGKSGADTPCGPCTRCGVGEWLAK
ncbi:MAG: radical SAM protein [Thermodesulfobacteriota bacterium]